MCLVRLVWLRAGLGLGIASRIWLGSCQRKGLDWLELVRVMVTDVMRHRHTKHMRPVHMENVV